MAWLRFSPLLLVIALAACPNPNTYTSARTLRAGDAQVLVAAEAYEMVDHDDVTGKTTTETVPSLPTVGVRYGLADSAEVGVRAVNLLSLAVDTKVQLHRGDLDVALDPGLQWYSAEGSFESEGKSDPFAIHIFDLHVPLLLGVNISPRTSFIVSPGFSARMAVPDFAMQYFGLAGLGLNIRVTRRFALQPQFTLAWDVVHGGGAVAGGLGFTFGGQPSFNELAPPTEPPQLARN